MWLLRQDISSVGAAWRMLHSSVRRIDYITGLVVTLQDAIRYFTMQPAGVETDTKDPPFQLVYVAR